jgi:hypothetical protein
MHLIVVRRDLRGFQHLHPTMSDDGTWRTRIAYATGGAWRAFADFATAAGPSILRLDVLVGATSDLSRCPRRTRARKWLRTRVAGSGSRR